MLLLASTPACLALLLLIIWRVLARTTNKDVLEHYFNLQLAEQSILGALSMLESSWLFHN